MVELRRQPKHLIQVLGRYVLALALVFLVTLKAHAGHWSDLQICHSSSEVFGNLSLDDFAHHDDYFLHQISASLESEISCTDSSFCPEATTFGWFYQERDSLRKSLLGKTRSLIFISTFLDFLMKSRSRQTQANFPPSLLTTLSRPFSTVTLVHLPTIILII